MGHEYLGIDQKNGSPGFEVQAGKSSHLDVS